MKNKYEMNALELFIVFFLGCIFTWAGFMVWSEVDYHAKCDGVVLTGSWGKNYCLDPELLEGAQP
ncbi:hypothetical protein UFOVP711_66 [uncultured Caudovirales phage]|uniref:Uncharacterized protein n=1 Tax=uncultured Caudovirales phage TaxID=2100421 RepID=A0A6J5NIT6_9CAUD|nr:hypothetical protein UFOVP711_66 [uncultured Caudovirales phage]